MSEVLAGISKAIIAGDVKGIAALTQQALDQGIEADVVLSKGLMPGMDHVGVEFKAGNVFVPEVLRSARAMQVAMDILRPILAESNARPAGKLLLGTVQGDLHDIGKNLVGMMCEGAGFEIKDLGKDASPDVFIRAVQEYQPDIVGMSALLTTTMRAMETTIKALEEAGLRKRVKIMVGGAPVTPTFANKIGADGYAANAAEAAELARRLISSV